MSVSAKLVGGGVLSTRVSGSPSAQTTATISGLSYLTVSSSPARVSSVTLYASAWAGSEGHYGQIVNIEGVTKNSKVDLQPTVEQLKIFHEKDIAFSTVNEGGIVVVHVIGDRPTNDYTMQVTITEVIV